MRDLGRLLRSWRGETWWLLAAMLVSLVTTLADLLLMATAGWFVTAMAAAGLVGATMNYFTPSAIIRFAAIVRTGGRWLDRVTSHEATFRLLAATRTDLFRRLEAIAPAGLDELRSAEVAARLKLDVDRLELVFLRLVSPLTVALAVGAVVTAAVAWRGTAGSAAVIALVFGLGGILGPFLAGHRVAPAARREAFAANDLRRAVVEHLEGLATLLVTGEAERRAARLRDAWATRIADERRVASADALGRVGQGLARDGALVFLLVFGAGAVASGGLAGPDLTALLLLTIAGFEATAPIPVAAAGLPAMLAAVGRLAALSARAPVVGDPARPVPLPERFDLVCDHVTFAHAGRAPTGLDGFDFALPEGGEGVLSQPSGWGKSSLVDLLVRARDPLAGEIRLGGVPIRDLALADLRATIAVAPQRPHVFAATIADNLRAFAPEASEAELRRALDVAGLTATVAAMPDGLATFVGSQGARLSGGEVRRLAVARVLLARDAKILVLDEPTEGLDAATARAVMDGLRRAAAGRSLLVVSHRRGDIGDAVEPAP